MTLDIDDDESRLDEDVKFGWYNSSWVENNLGICHTYPVYRGWRSHSIQTMTGEECWCEPEVTVLPEGIWVNHRAIH